MNGSPSSLSLQNGQTARVETGRLVVRLSRLGVEGKPLLTKSVRERLARLNLQVEGDSGTNKANEEMRAINHGPSLIWLRVTRRLRTASAESIAKALGRPLAWIAPVYRLPNVDGLDAFFCARPDVLLIRTQPGAESKLAEFAGDYGLIENLDKSRYLGGWRYFELQRTSGPNALALRSTIRRRAGDFDVEFEYVPLRRPFLFIPNDELFSTQWGMERIGAPRAWDLTRGDRRVIVAVIDSGCDLDHPDLRDSYVSRGTNAGDPSLDGSPVVIAPFGVSESHGTAVAGVIAAAMDNTIGVAGLASGCGILPVATPSGSTVEMAVAIRYAVGEGARVLNNSWSIGSFYFEMFIRAAIDEAIAAGCIVCGSAGNGDGSPLVVPARYAPVMACGGSQKDDARWRDIPIAAGGSFGDEIYDGALTGVSVAAPAEDIVTTDISGPGGFTPGEHGDYYYDSPTIPSAFDATSASAPHVSGAAALLMSLYPLSAAEVRLAIERTAEKTGGYSYADVPGYNSGSRHPEMGYGRLNIFRALDLGDVMIRDWPGDDGMEPSSPPGGDFFSFSDVVIRPGDDGVFRPDDPELASRLVRGVNHTAAVRVRNRGPASALGIQVDLRATPYAGTEFVYPSDWTLDDALHVRPAAIDAMPFDLAAGEEHTLRFGFTAEQVESMAGWSDSAWHPCLLARVNADNDYAFADAPTGPSLIMRRNNLAQRNLSVVVAATRSLHFPFVIGNPSAIEYPRFELIIEAGPLALAGEVYLLLADASRAFPAAQKAKAFAKGELKVGRVVGGKSAKFEGQRAVRLSAQRAVVELIKPGAGRFALQLAVRLPDKSKKGAQFPIGLQQRTVRGIVGGVKVVFVVDRQ